ncbi:hypothetical protein IEQ34_005215 [Dendrobium chrysotoxum]|uniref:Uncharacterized protein n=1 Tax=Dendrobium chrysotoxum TaxID=161865 RepID=A0AAV7H9G7_DENCH|nr:hypothetical protein IEQ34_005215 [Dendrobium chrysotoxum]
MQGRSSWMREALWTISRADVVGRAMDRSPPTSLQGKRAWLHWRGQSTAWIHRFYYGGIEIGFDVRYYGGTVGSNVEGRRHRRQGCYGFRAADGEGSVSGFIYLRKR